MMCPICDGEGFIEDYEDECCGNYLESGECCAALYGTAYVERVFMDVECLRCGGSGVIDE